MSWGGRGGRGEPKAEAQPAVAAMLHPPPPGAPNPALRATLNSFWVAQANELQTITDFKTHNLPLARIKKIMKSDEDVRMISSEAPALFAKACEMFILEARAADYRRPAAPPEPAACRLIYP